MPVSRMLRYVRLHPRPSGGDDSTAPAYLTATIQLAPQAQVLGVHTKAGVPVPELMLEVVVPVLMLEVVEDPELPRSRTWKIHLALPEREGALDFLNTPNRSIYPLSSVALGRARYSVYVEKPAIGWS